MDNLQTSNGASDEIRERRRWHAFWSEMPSWVKAAILAMAGLTVGGGAATSLLGGGTKVEERVLKLEIKLEGIEKSVDKMDGKLDRLLARRER